MKLDNIIRDSFELEANKLARIPSKEHETLEYILNYSQNRKSSIIANFRNQLYKIISSLNIPDVIGILAIIFIFFIVPRIIIQNKQLPDSNLANNSLTQWDTSSTGNQESKSNTINNINLETKGDTIQGIEAIKKKVTFVVELPKTLIDDLEEKKTYLENYYNKYIKDHYVVTSIYSGANGKKMVITQFEYTKTLEEIGEIGEKIRVGNLDILIQRFSKSEDGPIHAIFIKNKKLYQVECEKISKQKLIKFLDDFIQQ